MRLITWHLASSLGRLLRPAPQGKTSRTLLVPIGDGSYVEGLTGSWHTEVFGIEPSPASAQRISASRARVLCCAFEDARLGHGGWSGVVIEFPDPPAAADADRLDQHDFRVSGRVRRAAMALAPGGVFLGISRPETFTRVVTHALEVYLNPLHAFSAHNGHSDVLVVLGVAAHGRDHGRIIHHKAALADRAQPLGHARTGLAALAGAPAKSPLFVATTLTWEQATAEARRHGVWSDPTFATALHTSTPWDLHPLMPLARGHLGQLVAAGAFNNVLLPGLDNRPTLIKGRTDKTRRTHEEGPAKTTREAFRTSVVTLDPATGEFRVLDTGGDTPAQSDKRN